MHLDEAIKLIPKTPFKVPKPSRAQQVVWLEQARSEWLRPERQQQIYNHFVWNGKIPHTDGSFIRMSRREAAGEDLRAAVFGAEHARKKRRVQKAKAKQGEKDRAIQAAAEQLVALCADFEKSEEDQRDYLCALTGSDDPAAELLTVADIVQDGMPGIEYGDGDRRPAA